MDIKTLLEGIRGNQENAVSELIRSCGADVLSHAMALCDGNKPAAHTATAEAFRNTIAHIRAFPEEEFDQKALSALIDAQLLETVRKGCDRSVAEIVSGEGWQTLRSKQDGNTPHKRATPSKKKSKKTRFTVQFIILLVCVAIALWLLYGILASMGWLPYADLGYTWFNRNLFQVF